MSPSLQCLDCVQSNTKSCILYNQFCPGSRGSSRVESVALIKKNHIFYYVSTLVFHIIFVGWDHLVYSNTNFTPYLSGAKFTIMWRLACRKNILVTVTGRGSRQSYCPGLDLVFRCFAQLSAQPSLSNYKESHCIKCTFGQRKRQRQRKLLHKMQS